MRNTHKFLFLVFGVGGAALACARSPAESGADRSEPPVAEHPNDGVMNAYATERGDVEAARARAVSRLSATGPAAAFSTADAAEATASETTGTGTLVLYDTTGPWGWLGELYAMNVGCLVSHFGTWTAKPAASYVAGEINAYAGAVYVGSTFDEPLPVTLLDDVLSATRPVVWVDSNIWQLAARMPGFGAEYGFDPWYFDATSSFGSVVYKDTTLTRYLPNGAGVMLYATPPTATVLGEAVRGTDGSKIPWAVHGKNVVYVGENPMSYVTSNDRYLAFADILIGAFAPETPERHRALVRLEDVDAKSSPTALRAIADYLSAEGVPFSVATIPTHMDPNGYYSGGVPQNVPLRSAPQVASALRYMTTKGGTILLHGYTHQHGTVANPYSGVSADDFEFYRAHIDAADYVIYDGPVEGDSAVWAAGRIAAGMNELRRAALPAPTIFEFPHYAGSAADAEAVKLSFSKVYHRGLYFGGQLTGAPRDYSHVIGVMFPYTARDVYGFEVIPENLGSYEAEASNHNPPRLPADIIATAHANRVVRDGFASFYFHPYYPIEKLKEIVSGIKADGYTFVAASSL